MHQLLYFGLGSKMISKGIFLNNFGNLYMLQNDLLLNRGLLTGESPGEVA